MGFDTLQSQLRKLIIKDYQSGMSQKDICIKYDLEKSKISRLIKKFITTGCATVSHVGGRPRSTTPRQDSMIIRSVKKDPFKSSTIITKELKLEVSSSTVRRRLIEAKLYSRRPAKKPLISQKNRKRRLLFAKSHLNWTFNDWKKVLFSDESKFNVVSDGMVRVRRPNNARLEPRYCVKTVKHGGGNVMVWGCFSADGIGPLHEIKGIMTGEVYKEIMKDVMLPHADICMPQDWIFQQDNDPKHTSKVVKKWFQENNVEVLDWPAQSPDINPIENLWEIVDQQIDRSNIHGKAQLFQEITRAWEAISLDVIVRLIESMPRRCQAVINSKGFATKY